MQLLNKIYLKYLYHFFCLKYKILNFAEILQTLSVLWKFQWTFKHFKSIEEFV